jgi:hypothetical protein
MAEYGASFPILVPILCCHVEYAVLHRGVHAREVVVCSPLSGYGKPPWWTHGCLYDKYHNFCID